MKAPRMPLFVVSACLALAGLTGASANPLPASSEVLQKSRYAVKMADRSTDAALRYMLESGPRTSGDLPASLRRRLNQRQLRKNRRRAHAAGKRNAFV